METIQYQVQVKGSINSKVFDKTFDVYAHNDTVAVKRAIEVANMFILKCSVYSVKILNAQYKMVA